MSEVENIAPVEDMDTPDQDPELKNSDKSSKKKKKSLEQTETLEVQKGKKRKTPSPTGDHDNPDQDPELKNSDESSKKKKKSLEQTETFEVKKGKKRKTPSPTGDHEQAPKAKKAKSVKKEERLKLPFFLMLKHRQLKWTTPKVIILNNRRKTKISAVMKDIEKEYGVKSKTQQLYFNGNALHPTKDVFEYSISSSQTVELFEKKDEKEKAKETKKTNATKDSVECSKPEESEPKTTEPEEEMQFEEFEPDDMNRFEAMNDTVEPEVTEDSEEKDQAEPEKKEDSSAEASEETNGVEGGGEEKKDCEEDPYYCHTCYDNVDVPCSVCSCQICGTKRGKEIEDKTPVCDQCQLAYHPDCIGLSKEEAEKDEDWYCPNCVNDPNEINSRDGKKVKDRDRREGLKGRMNNGRAGGKFPEELKHWFGNIPGVSCGQEYYDRDIAAGSEGVHSMLVHGIVGNAAKGCVSVCSSGGYDDDEDTGYELIYTGSGGTDLSGNKRTSGIVSDQSLKTLNKAIAVNCAVPFSDKGGDAGDDWKKGKPIRVMRGPPKNAKHVGKFDPIYYRYDGLYKVVKYWQRKGKEGKMVWNFLLRRDDPDPAPWTEEGKKMIEERRLSLKLPPGGDIIVKMLAAGLLEVRGGSAGRTVRTDKKIPEDFFEKTAQEIKREKEELKPVPYEIPENIMNLINADDRNQKPQWENCIADAKRGICQFQLTVKSEFSCNICYKMVVSCDKDLFWIDHENPCHFLMCVDCVKQAWKKAKAEGERKHDYFCPGCNVQISAELAKECTKNEVTTMKEAVTAIIGDGSGTFTESA